jgi:fructokinase
MPDVICLGEAIVDLIAIDQNSSLSDTRGFYKFPGGATANVAVGICRMGASSGFLGAISSDPFGTFLKKSLEKEGVDISRMKVHKEEKTVFGFISVKNDQTKEVIFYRDPESEMFLSRDEIDTDFFNDTQIFHFGIICLRTLLKKQTTLKCLKIARDKGLTVSFDTNYRPHAWESGKMALSCFMEVIDKVDILKIADEEWPLFFGRKHTDEDATKLLDKGVKMVIVSRGPEGATLYTPDFKLQVPGFSVKVMETTGAGDAFMACLLAQITKKLKDKKKISSLKKENWKDIVFRSNAAGALTCMKAGAIPAIPDSSQIDTFLKSQ